MADSKKIMVVEDDRLVSKIYKIKLESKGYEVITAEDGDQALSLILSEMPDLIILDILMPSKSGFEVLDSIRANEQTKEIPVIVLTEANRSEEDLQKGLSKGANEYLVKSKSSLEQILEKIASYLN
ncbi:response regulator [Candidatus Gracilibacteria bacterium]|nr:response regulator [Candidatus Gracilibacteria bacterium]